MNWKRWMNRGGNTKARWLWAAKEQVNKNELDAFPYTMCIYLPCMHFTHRRVELSWHVGWFFFFFLKMKQHFMTLNKHNATCIQFLLLFHWFRCCYSCCRRRSRLTIIATALPNVTLLCYNPIFQSLLKCNHCALMKMPRMTKQKTNSNNNKKKITGCSQQFRVMHSTLLLLVNVCHLQCTTTMMKKKKKKKIGKQKRSHSERKHLLNRPKHKTETNIPV